MKTYEDFKFMRLLMVIGSFSPLFILIAIRGSKVVNNYILIIICLILIILPNIVLCWRINIAKNNKDNKEIRPIKVTYKEETIIIYLFAMLIPLFEANINSIRGLIAVIVAIIFLIFVFWKLNLHYINIFFALLGYGVFIAEIERFLGPNKTDKVKIVVLSKKELLAGGEPMQTYRISDMVYIKKED